MIFASKNPSKLAVILGSFFVILGRIDVILGAASFLHFWIFLHNQAVAFLPKNDTSFLAAVRHSRKFAFDISALPKNDRLTFFHSPYGRERRLAAFSPPSVEGDARRHALRHPKPVPVFRSQQRRCKRCMAT